MKCYDCNVEVEPRSHPEGECPECGLTYTLDKSNWQLCDNCEEPSASEDLDGLCLECYLDQK